MRSAAVVGLLALALLGGCDKPQPTAEIRPVRTVTAVAGSDGELVSLTGHIRGQKEQNLAFRIDGRMIKRHVEVGQVVRPNDLIAELDPVPQRGPSVTVNRSSAASAVAQTTLGDFYLVDRSARSSRTIFDRNPAQPRDNGNSRIEAQRNALMEHALLWPRRFCG